MKNLLLCAVLACSSAYGQEVSYEGLYSYDSEGARNYTTTVYAWSEPRDKLGFGVGAGDYRVTQSDATASAHDLRFGVRGKAESVRYEATIGQLSGPSVETVGAISTAWGFAPDSELGIRYARSLLDSVDGIDTLIMAESATAYVDYNATPWGVYAGYTRSDITDGNERDLLVTRTYYTMSDTYGLSVYLRTKHHQDSQPYTGTYFSPEHYGRWLTGVSIRQRLFGVTLAAHADAGQQYTEYDRTGGWTTAVSLESKHRNFSWKLLYGVDQTRSEYRYNYLYATATLNF